jgi:4-hydroxybenzoate polyprenyltransferase
MEFLSIPARKVSIPYRRLDRLLRKCRLAHQQRTLVRCFAAAPPPPPSIKDKHSDPPILTWVDQLPTRLIPYARLARIDKPIGTWLLLWPCCFSTALAAPAGSLPDGVLLGTFALGSLVMRGAGCTINDMWDADIDSKVQRTATRPLASSELSYPQAWTFLALQLSTGLGVLLSLPHKSFCFAWGAASLPLVVLYPTMKRWFPYPQLVLGLCFNWGAWMGWAAVHGSMDYALVAPLYTSCVTWTLVYDTIYAHQDKEEDRQLELQSTALSFGPEDIQRQVLTGLAVSTWLQWLWVGQASDMNLYCYTPGVTLAGMHLLWQIHTADFGNSYNLAERFRSNSTVGGIVFGSIVAGKFFV